MSRVEVERSFPHPVERVFRRYTDHEGWSEWAGLGRVRLTREGSPDRNGVGSVRAFSTAPGLREEVTLFEPPVSMGGLRPPKPPEIGVGAPPKPPEIGVGAPPKPPEIGVGAPPKPPEIGVGAPPKPPEIGVGAPPKPPEIGVGAPPKPPEIGVGAPPKPPEIGVGAPPKPPEIGAGARMEYRVVQGPIPLADHHGEVIFVPEGSGTRVTWRVSFRSKIPGLGWPMERGLGVLFRRMLASLARDLDGGAPIGDRRDG